ncbi:MAG: ankyrin repeat domain-containing protein [Rubrivivax sp.]|nr:ankyrin repeat domain-containing protein [Rubrivivax sp.]
MKKYMRYVAYLVVALMFHPALAGSYEDFFRAVNVDNDRAVAALLSRGFDPNAPDEKGQVGLFLALRDGSPKVVAALLAHPQVKIDAPNASNETPVMMAALRGEMEWVARLLDRGAKINRPGWSPLHYAAAGPEPQVVALLLDRGAQMEASSPNRTTPLMMAARYGDERSANLLLARGASPKARNDLGLTAADFARQGGREALAARLEQAAR